MTLPISTKTKLPKKISWDTFQKKYLIREDKYKYEWLDGYVEKTRRTMNKNQFYILANLMNFLSLLKGKDTKIDGLLIAEGDTFFASHHRRPDIAYYTKQQIIAARKDEVVVPAFVIEIISTTDQINRVQQKMEDYLAAKVKVVWHIFPELKTIHVYQGKKMEIKKGTDNCSAEAVIKGFSISVDDVFK